MNTLFAAMIAHSIILSSTQWKFVFQNIIFSLFRQAGARSKLAMNTSEEAIAPELKKV